MVPINLLLQTVTSAMSPHGPPVTTWLQLGKCDQKTAIVWELDEVRTNPPFWMTCTSMGPMRYDACGCSAVGITNLPTCRANAFPELPLELS